MTGTREKTQQWHAQAADALAAELGVELATGLSAAEVAARTVKFGPNALREKPPRPRWRMFADQFADFMILVLLVAAVLSGLMGDAKDAAAIIVIVVLNAGIGFVQELRAAKAMAALKKMAGSRAQVRREGQSLDVPAEEIVPGDVLLLEAGDVVAADLRLIEVAQLKLDESLLTGEAVPSEKTAAALTAGKLPLGDQRNIAFKGTIVSYGRGVGIVVATGMQTELGKIAGILDAAVEPATPLQKRLAVFGRWLLIATLAICAAFFVICLLRGQPLVLMLMTAVSLTVAAIPEALPAVVSISLALGARRMVQQHVLVRRLPAVETLGSVTYICSDKTGTLTENRMRMVVLHATRPLRFDAEPPPEIPASEPWPSLMRALALSNDATRNEDGTVSGDPTEVALFKAAFDAGFAKAELEKAAERVFELPFDSDRKRMSTVHRHDSGFIAYTKGAPESVLPLCRAALGEQGEASFDDKAMLSTAEGMAAEGLRVLAVAQRHWTAQPHKDEQGIEAELVFLGLIGLIDPARPEAQSAIALCRSAGIRAVMITGDHPATACAVARQLGMQGEAVLSGPQLTAMNDEDFAARVADIEVYARVDPAQKIRIVEALQKRGEFVAMTGDGVNDAPALKRADIGIAMGKGGTDVAREASSLILLDDNFATIVQAVREGRRIFDNIRKFIRYAMTGNSAEIWTLFLAPLLGLPIPLLPIHLLWVNLITDGLPGLALAVEPAERGLMQRPPRPPAENIFAHGLWQSILIVGLAVAALSLGVQAWAIETGSAHWQTMVFTVLTLSQLAMVLGMRSERASVFKAGLFSNRPLIGAVLISVALQMATLYVPALNTIFRTAPLSFAELAICLLLSALALFIVELEKLLRRRWPRSKRHSQRAA
ncbi:cation-translocating P-type ATPase [Uliginosibacterium sediminicola]|uniref:Cation-translocating P-type ATPase n=1 Tax=Uliginosibacterium sediminicola TaxID=2024550 RepID=A0ABU9Z3Z9_9RHOO